MDKVLVVSPERCTGCHFCEMACSLAHGGTCDLNLSRIGIMKTRGGGSGENIPVVCRQCEDPICADVCIMGAISRDADTGALIVDENLCVGCKTCVTACPRGGVIFHPAMGYAIKCDLCGGNPECVKVCTYEALQYLSVDEWTTLQRRKGLENLAKIYEAATS